MEKQIREQYKELGIPKETLDLINKELKLPDEKLASFARPRRIEAFNEALSWKKGPSQDKKEYTKLYNIKEYTIEIGKPGKEAAPGYKHKHYKACPCCHGQKISNNKNDMEPRILKNGSKIDKSMSFEDIFDMIETVMYQDRFGMELFGMLLFRAAFMLDHYKNNEGGLRYIPPEKAVRLLEERIPLVSGIPIRVFLHFLEVLSLNEDIKTYTFGYKEFKSGYGRTNTLLTFVNVIAVILQRQSLYKLLANFARPPAGMAPIPKTKITEFFPLLSPDWNQEKL